MKFPENFSFLHPQNWTWKFYLWVSGILLGLNLLGSRGLVHHIILLQEEVRLKNQAITLQQQIDENQIKVKNFNRYPVARARAIREELGYLLKEEISYEFLKDQQAEPHLAVGPASNP